MNYALENDTLILYDAAYEAYIQDPDIPHSIYEIKGAKKVANAWIILPMMQMWYN